MASDLEGLRTERLRKAADWQAAGINPYAYRYAVSHTMATLQATYADLAAGDSVALAVQVAGRIMLRRVFGKLAFFTLRDRSGTIQLYLDKATITAAMGEAAFDHLKKLTDAGDWLGAAGTLKRTDKGELSVVVEHYEILTKSLLPLPDKWHGLKDVETRYRQRYLDLIVNPEVQQTFRDRALIVRSLRRTLEDQDFIEIETPVLQAGAGGAEARPFITHHNALDIDLYLRIATELHLKRLIVGGFERVYELGRIFRNEGISTRHNPEFTSVEVYQAYADYHDMMDLTETMIVQAAQAVLPGLHVDYQGETIDLTPPWRRLTMRELVQDATGLDFAALAEQADGLDIGKAKLTALGLKDLAAIDSLGLLLVRAFEDLCEESLRQPTFVIDFPVENSPLAKPHRSLPGFVERFELYIVGRETANSFSELTDPLDQRQRLEAQAALKAAGNPEAHFLDEDFLTALEYGMPPREGWALVLTASSCC